MEREKSGNRIVSIDYLRAFLTLLVLCHHAAVTYATFAHQDKEHFLASSAPIVDVQRWFVLDVGLYFNDIFFMSLMFFISGLFVLPLLREKGPMSFLRDRFVRLGIPFVIGVVIVIPFSYYPSWLSVGGATGYVNYFRSFIDQGWSGGPLWFIWMLLLFDAVTVGLFTLLPKRLTHLFSVKSVPKAFIFLFIVSLVVYVPMAAHFGTETWKSFFTPPFWFQVSRIFLYLIWFFGGILIGSQDLQAGLLSEKGSLAKRWPWWIGASIIVFNVLLFIQFGVKNFQGPEIIHDLVVVILWVACCCTSCFALLSVFCALFTKRSSWMDSIARSAYMMYFIHYVYVNWVQYFLMNFSFHASVKFLVTCVTVILLSWFSSWMFLKIPRVKSVM